MKMQTAECERISCFGFNRQMSYRNWLLDTDHNSYFRRSNANYIRRCYWLLYKWSFDANK